MKAMTEQWSIVITGQWNPHIFSAEWVAKNLIEKDESDIKIQVGFSRGFPVRLRMITERFTLVPAQDRIVFHPAAGNEEDLKILEDVALKTLETLPHTPVTGYGVNFHFLDDSSGGFDHSLFNADDYEKYSKFDCETLDRKIFRKIKIDDQTILNLTLALIEDVKVDIDMNFHRSISANDRPDELKEKLSGSIISRYEKGLELLKKVYNFELDLEDFNDD
ncbi:MAG: hypothetical protein KF886_04410 [Candidatus Hydrogenedentes bacterium]|nr:hypothetical protein [Candidatus Hydrogenedentota bacterium]